MSVRSYLVVHPDGGLLWDTGIADAMGAEPAGVRITDTEDERNGVYGPDPERLTYIPEAYAALDRGRIATISGEHDLFDDGTVVMVPLPGHTPGHQGLLVTLRATGPVLLAGDIAYSTKDYVEGAVRRGHVDLDASRRSIETARRLERERGATVWLHHHPDAQRLVRTAPSFYG